MTHLAAPRAPQATAPQPPTRSRGPLRRRAAALAAAALAAGALTAGPALAAGTPALRSASVPNYASVLENASSRTLYVLSIEQGTKLHCTGACLSVWTPMLVKSSTKSITLGAGVKGKIGFVRRSATMQQVTFNGYPLYAYRGDSGAGQSHGEAVVGDGGTWFLANAAAKSAAATPVLPLLLTASIAGFSHVLQDHRHDTLYLLSVEQHASLHCTGSCLSVWPPVLVANATAKVAVEQGVAGTVGFVSRGSMQQLTYNGYPVYTYTGDSGPNQSNGQGIVADGGTWWLVNAAATSAQGTPITAAAARGW